MATEIDANKAHLTIDTKSCKWNRINEQEKVDSRALIHHNIFQDPPPSNHQILTHSSLQSLEVKRSKLFSAHSRLFPHWTIALKISYIDIE